MMHRIFMVLSWFLLLVACSDEKGGEDAPAKINTPEGIIGHEQMVEVLADYYLAENTIRYYMQYGASPKPLSKKMYDTVLEKHELSREEFNRSMDYYMDEISRMKHLYTDVREELNSIHGNVRRGD